MEEVLYYNELYDLYGELLTDKQRKYYEDYYFNDLSLGEMADLYGVSRNAIFKQVHNVTNKLEDYEKKLGLLDKKNSLLEIINTIKDKNVKNNLNEIVDKF
ncbi:MAG: hypothetical protein IKG58_00270 [Bacilli bacterium]|nr:hypothetical protein [Bacilli bacterium]MBR3048980.1 hypothetical protein [Bacilli bacterium]